MTPMVSALMPMKGESERVPRKNTRLIGGRPLFHYALENLLRATRIGDIVVDTDSDRISQAIARDFPSVKIVVRPPELLGAKVPLTPIIDYDLKFIECEHFLQTHATTPLLRPETIDAAVDLYFDGLASGHDSVIGVTPYHTRFYDRAGKPINHDPDVMVPSQDMPPLFEDNSSLYINSVEAFRRRNNRVGARPIFHVVPKLESLDIDTEDDVVLVEAMLSHLRAAKS